MGPDLLQKRNLVFLLFLQHQFTISADTEGMFLQVELQQPDEHFLFSVSRGPHFKNHI